MRLYLLISLLLLFSDVYSQRACEKKCVEKFSSEKELKACKEGCRLAVIFNLAQPAGKSTSSSAECRKGCDQSYAEGSERDSCSFGCDSQPVVDTGRVEISFTNEDPTFNAARGAMNRMFWRMSDAFPSFGGFGRTVESEEFEDPFTDMRRRMQEEMARIQQVVHRLFQHAQMTHLEPHGFVAINRPSGHLLQSLQGQEVGNKDKDGSLIIEAVPSSHRKVQLLGHRGENPAANEEHESPSWLSWVAMRARRLSVLSQWLVCAALLLCLISMLAISIAILKQIRLQKYKNLRSARVVVPATFGEPLPAKKIPLESPSAAMDYPLIHDSPPPAYDQLSMHKEKLEEKEKEEKPSE